MVPLRSSRARARTLAITSHSCWFLRGHPIQRSSLGSRRFFLAPPADLLGVDGDEFRLFRMDSFDPIDSGVVEHVRRGSCFGQSREVLARVVERGIDHAGDQRHLTDRLPVHPVTGRHAG
jgi:hypothetical protein